jgi:hypothetical protein
MAEAELGLAVLRGEGVPKPVESAEGDADAEGNDKLLDTKPVEELKSFTTANVGKYELDQYVAKLGGTVVEIQPSAKGATTGGGTITIRIRISSGAGKGKHNGKGSSPRNDNSPHNTKNLDYEPQPVQFCRLTYLNIGANRLGMLTGMLLAEALRCNTTLTALEMWDNNLGGEGAEAIMGAIGASSAAVAEAAAASEAAGEYIAPRPNTASGITHLNLAGNAIGFEGAGAVAAALKGGGTVTSLDMADNRLGAAGAAPIADLIALRPVESWGGDYEGGRILTSLSLAGNQLGQAGAALLVDALRSNTNLVCLQLQRNKLGRAGMALMAEAVKLNYTISKLELDDGEEDDDGGAAALALGAQQAQQVRAQQQARGQRAQQQRAQQQRAQQQRAQQQRARGQQTSQHNQYKTSPAYGSRSTAKPRQQHSHSAQYNSSPGRLGYTVEDSF